MLCERCGDHLEATDHKNVNDPDRRTIETQTCISCGWTTEVQLCFLRGGEADA